jgi:hypothetical protein
LDKERSYSCRPVPQRGNITQSTLLSELAPLSERDQRARPFDIGIRRWEGGNGQGSEYRLVALSELIRENLASMITSVGSNNIVGGIRVEIVCERHHSNDCVEQELFDWEDVQPGEDISDRTKEARQVTFAEIINVHALAGICCSGDMVTEENLDAGREVADMQNLDDSAIAPMPRSLQKLGGGHPFVGNNKGVEAQKVLAAMAEAGTIRVARKASAGLIIPDSLKEIIAKWKPSLHAMNPQCH